MGNIIRRFAVVVTILFALTAMELRAAEPSLAPGDTFVYDRSMRAGTDVLHQSLLITINSVTASGYTGTVVFMRGKRSDGTAKIVKDASGWTSLSQSDKAHDIIDYDPAAFCPLPPNVVTGQTWHCNIQHVGHYFPAGSVTVKAVFATPHELQIIASGVADQTSQDPIDSDTGKPVHVDVAAHWQTHATYVDGVLHEENTVVHSMLNINGSTVPDVQSVSLKLQSRHP